MTFVSLLRVYKFVVLRSSILEQHFLADWKLQSFLFSHVEPFSAFSFKTLSSSETGGFVCGGQSSSDDSIQQLVIPFRCSVLIVHASKHLPGIMTVEAGYSSKSSCSCRLRLV